MKTRCNLVACKKRLMPKSWFRVQIKRTFWRKFGPKLGTGQTQLEAPKLESGAKWGSIKAPNPIHEEMCVGKIPNAGGNTNWRITNECVYKLAPFANGFSFFCRPRVRHNQQNRNDSHGHGTIENDERPFAKASMAWKHGCEGKHGCVEGFTQASRQTLHIWTRCPTPHKQQEFQLEQRGKLPNTDHEDVETSVVVIGGFAEDAPKQVEEVVWHVRHLNGF